MPDEQSGEVPKAFVVRVPGSTVSAEEIIDYVAGRVARYKRVRVVEFIDMVPTSLGAVMDSLEADHEFLLRGEVFSKELIETWIAWKRENEIDAVRLRPHPAEFALYFDC